MSQPFLLFILLLSVLMLYLGLSNVDMTKPLVEAMSPGLIFWFVVLVISAGKLFPGKAK